MIYFSFSIVPSGGASLLPAVITGNLSLQTTIQYSIATVASVAPSAVQIKNVTDLATGAVTLVSSRRLQRRVQAAGSMGVSVTVSVNVGKSPSAANLQAVQQKLQQGLGASSMAATMILASTASAASLQASQLTFVPPASFSVAGAAAAGATVVVVQQDQNLALDEGAGAGIGIIVVAMALALYSYRSYKLHGALPCYRDRLREIRILKTKTAEEVEAKIMGDTVLATDNPVGAGGSSGGRLTLRIPKQAAAELERIAQSNSELMRELALLKGSVPSAEELADVKRMRQQRAAQAELDTGSRKTTSRAFAPTRIGSAAGTGISPTAASSAVPAPLPAGWRAIADVKSGRTYYANSVTQATSWERPTGGSSEV